MRAKLDENLPLQIATRLRDLGHDVHTTQQESLSGCDDSELWKAAQREAVSEWAGCFVVVTEQKVRVRRAPTKTA
jgi:predicted nuclease of predicted toxin-antitoxin system